MQLAIELAAKGKGTTSPNPRVGTVVVKNGEIVGQGYHKRAGEDHAEVIALKQADKEARGSSLYVTLEPCSTHGKMPPCTDLIVAAGVKEVIVAGFDPNPKHNGKGIEFLKKRNIKVVTGVLQEEAEKLNEGFKKFITMGLPFVTVKAALSLDGKLATSTGESRWLTSEESRNYVHKMRNETDAILVGLGTVIKDNPHLTVRGDFEEIHTPKKIVVDALAEISLQSNLLSKEIALSTIVAVTDAAAENKTKKIRDAGAEIIYCKGDGDKVDLNDLMQKLGKKGIVYLMVESGSRVITSAFESGIVDKIALFYGTKIIGGVSAPSLIMGEGAKKLEDAIEIYNVSFTILKDNVLIEGFIKK